MFSDLGYRWISSRSHVPGLRSERGEEPPPEYFDAIAGAQAETQPYLYPNGLLEIPFSPISDISAFRSYRWKLEYFLEAIRRGLSHVIEHGQVYDFLSHPSCLGVVDPEFRAIDLICDLVDRSKGRARIVGLDTIARRFLPTRAGVR